MRERLRIGPVNACDIARLRILGEPRSDRFRLRRRERLDDGGLFFTITRRCDTLLRRRLVDNLRLWRWSRWGQGGRRLSGIYYLGLFPVAQNARQPVGQVTRRSSCFWGLLRGR